MALSLDELLEKAKRNRILEKVKTDEIEKLKRKIRNAEILKMYQNHGVILDSIMINFGDAFSDNNSHKCFQKSNVEKKLFDYSFFNCKQILTR